jgi:ribonuclease-3
MTDDLPGDLPPGEKAGTRPRAQRDAKAEIATAGDVEAAGRESEAEPKSASKPMSASEDTADGAAKPTKRKRRKATARENAKAVEERIGHTFSDPSLLTTALTHVSALKSPNDRAASYQRLEFLGDHVLGLVISDMLYRAFPKADEGELSKRLADLVRRETCADVARAMGLHEAIKLGAVGSAGAGERLRKSVLGDICEAVIGAVYLDGGYPAAAKMIGDAWADRMRKPMRALRDPKTVLQEWAQGKGLPTPAYREVERTGPHHDPQFRVAVDLPGLAPAEGVGSSKRNAEKAAASALLVREGVMGGGDV